ncbi:MAG: GGDEF domain-containing protein [Proteobacteria bacterium]|nr:GGDEF domain-containing protein [Pseudomonadota bacterium]
MGGQPTLVETVTVAGKPIEDGAELPYEPGIIDVHYVALSFESASEIGYRYRLLGASEDWLESSGYRPLSFANLGAGNYSFEVTARKSGGEWNPDISRFRFSIDSPFWQTTWFWLLTVLVFGGLVWWAMRMKVQQARQRERELEKIVEERTHDVQRAADALKLVNDQLQRAAITDPLTGLLNRRYLTSQIPTDVAQTRRLYRGDALYPNRDIVFMMIDLDFFKQINDTYGHAAGDHVLRGYGAVIRNEMRESDYVVRWGGEEFLVIARNTEASQSRVIAERIHNAVKDRTFVLDDGTELSVTCSIGVSHLPLFVDEPDAVNWEHVIEIADIAVYMSKALGRNGWVSIRGVRAVSDEDPTELLHRIRTDLPRLVDEGAVIVESSFDSPVNASAADKPPGMET